MLWEQAQEEIILPLMRQHGVGHVNLSLEYIGYDFARTDFDYDTASAESIYFNASEFFTLTDDEIRHIAIHEIAHAMLPFTACHRHVWRRQCKSLGIFPHLTFTSQHMSQVFDGIKPSYPLFI